MSASVTTTNSAWRRSIGIAFGLRVASSIHRFSQDLDLKVLDLEISEIPLPMQVLRHFLPVQLGLREKLKFWRKNARNLCTHILGSPTPILRANCAGAPPHKFRTISAHFRMPPHIFRTNFLGPVENAPRTSFAQFFRTHGLFSKSASVQAMNVSMQV